MIAIDYLTKWAEAEALATITTIKIQNFVWRNIICRFVLLKVLFTDNGKQFDYDLFRDFYKGHGIENHYSSLVHPQVNGQVEVINNFVRTQLETAPNCPFCHWIDCSINCQSRSIDRVSVV